MRLTLRDRSRYWLPRTLPPFGARDGSSLITGRGHLIRSICARSRPDLPDMRVIVRLQDHKLCASITFAHHALCGPKGADDRRSPT
jgi:hypothetical protein